MKRSLIILNLAIIQILTFNAWSAIPESRQLVLIDKNWKFIQSDVKDGEKQIFDDSKWRTLNLPHDWSIEGEFKEDAITKGPGGYLPAGIGWYRKHLNINSIAKDQQFWIEFDGVYMNSDVWINGQHLGKSKKDMILKNLQFTIRNFKNQNLITFVNLSGLTIA